jgi:uncharacterized protein
MKLIRYSDLAVLPWKNGAGIRRDVAQGHVQLEGQEVTWLLSIADLNEDAQFSSYPDITRWFAPITTGWITLNFFDGANTIPVELTEISPAHKFSGDAKVSCVLHDGPMKALNIMTSAANPDVTIQRLKLADTTWVTLPSTPQGVISMLFVSNGVCRVKSDTWSGPVAKFNTLVNTTGSGETFEISPLDSTNIILATIKLTAKQPKESVPG